MYQRVTFETLDVIVTVVERTAEGAFLPGELTDDDGGDYAAEMTRSLNEAAEDYDIQMDGPNDGFNYSSRFHVSAFEIDLPVPADDNDQPAWDAYNAAEKAVMVDVITGVAAALAERGITVPTLTGEFATSHYAGCLHCKCSPGLIARTAVRLGDSHPLDFYISPVK